MTLRRGEEGGSKVNAIMMLILKNSLKVSPKQKFDYSFLYLLGLEDLFSATEDVVVHLDTFGSPQHDSACFGGKL